MDIGTFESHESEVRSYCRDYPTVFQSSHSSTLVDESGKHFVDFLAGAGSLNYGHNNSEIMEPVLEYLKGGGVVQSLDMHTSAKLGFIEAFQSSILKARNLEYKIQFPGPTGTNAVEAALKLARKVTGRKNIVSFTGGFHGMTLGALAVSTNTGKRAGAGTELQGASFMPYEGFLGNAGDEFSVTEALLMSPGSGIDKPAAFIVEMVQGEGGLAAASREWIMKISDLAKELGALLIIDDIQAGIGRTETFFSFEGYGIDPDIVILSKSLSGFGTPFSVVLIKPEHDQWKPGEHNGTFRGNNLAFVGAKAAIDTYWQDNNLTQSVNHLSGIVKSKLEQISHNVKSERSFVRGRGLLTGIEFEKPQTVQSIVEAAFKKGVIVEACGARGTVLKLMPPLTIENEVLLDGLEKISEAISQSTDAQQTQAA